MCSCVLEVASSGLVRFGRQEAAGLVACTSVASAAVLKGSSEWEALKPRGSLLRKGRSSCEFGVGGLQASKACGRCLQGLS